MKRHHAGSKPAATTTTAAAESLPGDSRCRPILHRRWMALGGLQLQLLLVLVVWWMLPVAVHALYAEDAGRLDFWVTTTGHGPVTHAHRSYAYYSTQEAHRSYYHNHPILITSGSASCYVAGRNWETGQVLWRRWVSTTTSSSTAAAAASHKDCCHVTVVQDTVVTAAKDGTVRGWKMTDGSLLWEHHHHHDSTSTSSSIAKLWTVPETNHVAWQQQGTKPTTMPVVVLDVTTGTIVENDNDKSSIIKQAKASKPPANEEDTDRSQVFCEPAAATVKWNRETNTLVATTSTGSTLGEHKSSSSSEVLDHVWLIDCQPRKMSVLATSRRGTSVMITFGTSIDAAAGATTRVRWTAREDLAQITSALMLDDSHAVTTIPAGGDSDDDSSRTHDGHRDEAAAAPERVLQFSTRLALQWQSVQQRFSGLLALQQQQQQISSNNDRDHLFGFVKIAVLLSPHGVYGMETAGPRRAQLRYQIELPYDEHQQQQHDYDANHNTPVWQHRLVHGSTNSEKGVHGINGGAHTRQVLVLSSSQIHHAVQWICLDGTSGEIYGRGSLTVAAPIVQILPVANKGAGSSCRQDAILLLQDHSLVSVTGNDDWSTSKNIPSHKNLFAHYLDPTTSALYSLGIITAGAGSGGGVSTHLVGSAVFPGEDIVAVAYPPREEVIQSPCSVLGDDSLLLKYLNPHLAVIVTMTSPSSSLTTTDDEFPLKPKKTSKQKRKPVGVTQPGEPIKTDDKPNFFVNVVDTVSARVLYRASHANALRNPDPSVLVSENWVFYTFVNAKTRKAELGVLSLYEGMIDKSGLTAFASPEQLTSFSSLDARETKPVVLAKTYTIPMPATALGMTSTRSGISGRHLLLATLDGKIQSIGRKLLEPRRPLGQLKESEKKEGLVQYHEVIQTVSYMTLSYNQTVEGVKSIVTAPTDVESQTLILAFGGPDIFFARTAPSKGFDLLPDNFNRVLLSIVVAALVAALVTLRRLVSNKVVKQGWV